MEWMGQIIFERGGLRNLRSTPTNKVEPSDYNKTLLFDDTENASRELWPLYCKDVCAGYATRTCRVAKCLGYRRRQLDQSNRGLFDLCEYGKSIANEYLNWLANETDPYYAVSNTCQSFLAPSKRSVECFDDSMYGEITRLKAFSTTVIPLELSGNVPPTGFTVCKRYASVVFVADVNLCVLEVRFEQNGRFGYDQSYVNRPPFEYEFNSAFIGDFTLSVTPNRLSSKKKTYQIKVLDC